MGLIFRPWRRLIDFGATGADPLDPRGSGDFATSVVWMGGVVATLADGSTVIAISDFLTGDVVGILGLTWSPRAAR